MEKVSFTEKYIIAQIDSSKYKTYKCDEHGFFHNNIETDNKKCPHCQRIFEEYPNMTELQIKYKKELNLS